MNFAIIVALFSSFILTQCAGVSKMEVDTDAKYHISPLRYPIAERDEINNFIDSVKIVNLEYSENSLFKSVRKLLVLDNGDFIIADKRKICHFSAQGKHIRNYGMEGRAANEYASVGDICVDNKGSLIVLDPMSKVLYYSLKTGRFIKTLTPQWAGEVKRVDGIIPDKDGGFFIVSANASKLNSTEEYNCLTKFDSHGKEVSQRLPTNDFVYMNALVTQSLGAKYLIRPLNNSNITYEVDVNSGDITPLCQIDFGDKNVPSGAAFTTDGQPYFPKLIETDSYKIPSYFQRTKSHITFLVAGPVGESYTYVHSTSSNNGLTITSPNRKTMPVKFLGSDESFLYMVMDKYSMDGVDEYADQLTAHLMKEYGILSENDNLRIIGIKFK